MSGDEARKRPRRRLFWRIYLYGLLFVAAVACTMFLVQFVVGDRPPPMHEGLVRTVMDGCMSDPARLKTRLEDLCGTTRMSAALFTWDGGRVLSAGPNPPQPLPPEKIRAVGKGGWTGREHHEYAVPVKCPPDFDGYLVVGSGWRPSLWPLAVMALLVFVLLAMILLPLARTIAKPLEKITETARLLGDGKFSARTGVTGSDEIGVLAGTFDEMAGRIERLMKSERELLANISHEIRTPLARIHLAAELCGEDDVGVEELKGHLKGITGDLAELDRLIDDVLMTTRLDLAANGGLNTGFRLRTIPLRLELVVKDADDRFKGKWPGYRLETVIKGHIPLIEADPAMLRRVLDNLLDNAARYSGEDKPVALAVELVGREVRIEVRDNGIGIPEEDMSRIFEPFFRTDRARSRHAGGVGLGLTLCKRIVEAHGGRISAAKNPEGGTVFTIVIPYMEGTEEV